MRDNEMSEANRIPALKILKKVFPRKRIKKDMNWYTQKLGQALAEPVNQMPELNQDDEYIAASMNDMRSIDSSLSGIRQMLDKARLPGAEIHFEPWIFQKITTARNDLNDAKLGLSEQIGGK